MAKYFAHKPQWRRGTTPRPAPVLEFNRDFRSGEFNFTGPVYQPDPRSAPGRVPSVPRKTERRWGSPVNFNVAAGREAAAKRQFYKNLGRGLGGIVRGLPQAMDLWEMYDNVQKSLGGEPYSINREELLNGGPQGTEPTWQSPYEPDRWFTIPSPDGQPFASQWDGFGWNIQRGPYFYETMMGHTDSFIKWRLRPHDNIRGGLTGSFSNPNGSYPIPVADGWEFPTINDYSWGRKTSFSWPHEWGSAMDQPVSWDGTVQDYFLRYWFNAPTGAPTPVITGTPAPVETTDGSPQQILDNWPRTIVQLPTLLPWGGWKPGPAWEDIPARNRMRARDPSIREESYGPPLQPNKPPSVIHRPPGRYETESKRRTTSGAVLWWYRAAKKTWHEAGEYCDRVDAMYEALPKHVRLPYRSGKPIACHEKTAVLLRNLHLLDVEEAIINLVVNEIEDRIIGAGFKSLDDAARKLNIPGWRVDLAMNGNVETAIEFLFEIKKALTP